MFAPIASAIIVTMLLAWKVEVSRFDPKGDRPELLEAWPSDKPVFLPENKVRETMKMKKK